MQIVIEQSVSSRQDLNKRISSANFNSKKIKSILSSRQTCDDIVFKVKDATNKNDPPQQANDHYKLKNKRLPPQQGQLKIKVSDNQLLADLVKPLKHDKTHQQTLILKNSDKTKLIFWNKDLHLAGNEKYLLVSADLVIDQDCFWDKLPSDNGNFLNSALHTSHTLATLNHNSTLSYRSRNNLSSTNQAKMIYGSTQTIPNASQKNKNPLFSSNKLTLLIKQWKNLHSRFDSQGRKIIILWLIRKQSTYSHLMEFSQANQLPVHGIFYAKRKRANAFVDIGPIVKEINQRFLESVINPHPTESNPRGEEHRSINLSQEMRKGRSKQPKNKDFIQSVSVSSSMKKHMDVISNKIIKSKLESKHIENDENSSSALNSQTALNSQSQTCKQFQLSKKGKKSLGSIIIDEKRVRSILKKTGSICSTRVIKQASMKVNETKMTELTDNSTTINEFRAKCDVSPIMDEVKEPNEQALIKEFEENEKVTKKFMVPQIIIFEGSKCNSKAHCQGNTYHGKVPILFDYFEERLGQVIQKLKEQKIEIEQNEGHQFVKAYYFKYETIKQNGFESINSLVRELVLKNVPRLSEFTYETSKLQNFRDEKIKEIMKELPQNSTNDRMIERQTFKHSEKEMDDIELTQEQEEILISKTEKKIEEVKKQTIDRMISLKGRNYTFENGESIYYFVGDSFKRNYNLFYKEYYRMYEKEMLSTLVGKGKTKEKSPATRKKHEYSRTTDCSTLMGMDNAVRSNSDSDSSGNVSRRNECPRMKGLKLSHIQFYESLNY